MSEYVDLDYGSDFDDGSDDDDQGGSDGGDSDRELEVGMEKVTVKVALMEVIVMVEMVSTAELEFAVSSVPSASTLSLCIVDYLTQLTVTSVGRKRLSHTRGVHLDRLNVKLITNIVVQPARGRVAVQILPSNNSKEVSVIKHRTFMYI